MKRRISTLSLIVFTAMLFLSTFLTAVPGGYGPWFTIMALFTLPPLIWGLRWQKCIAAVGFLLGAGLIFSNTKAGQLWEKHYREWREAKPDQLSDSRKR